MQTTLLGVAIAFILALVAALAGPYFVDWNQFRPQFEAEASRVVGSPVRVTGALDARLLPTPILRLQSVEVGGPNDPSRVRAEKLDVEFSLPSLMRGEWRATELSLQGLDLNFGLDRQGRIDWPVSRSSFDFGSLAIDRLNLAGRIVLHDGASGGSLTLDDLKFSGDVRALAGALRGEGSARISGVHMPFRVSSGETADGKGSRVRLVLEGGDRPLSAEIDGNLTFEGRSPRFDGAVTLTHASETPWRATAKAKADPAVVAFEQVDVSYGPDDVALKFSGSGGLRLGAQSLLQLSLSAKQLDADRLLLKGKPEGSTVRVVPQLRSLLASLSSPPVPMQIDVSADQIALGSRPVKDITVALHGDKDAWTIDGLSLRAPGATRFSAGGTLSGQQDAARFAGAIQLESSDPAALMSWLAGRGDLAFPARKPFSLAGRTSVSADGVALENMKADFEGGAVEGRIAVSPARIEAALTSNSLDLDATTELLRALGATRDNWPDEAHVSLDAARGTLAGQEVRPVAVEFAYGPQNVSVDRLKIGGAGGVTLNGQGAFDRSAATGQLNLDASAPSLARFSEVIAPFAPAVADRLKTVSAAKGNARVRLTASLAKTKDGAGRTAARAVLDLEGSGIKGSVTLTASPATSAMTALDFGALAKTDVTLESKFSSQQGQTLLALAGLDGIVTAGDGPGRFESSITGTWGGDSRIKAVLSANGLDADVQGSGKIWASEPKATAALAVRKANLAPLFGLTDPTTVSLTSKVTVAGERLIFDNLDTTVAKSRIRGKLAVTRGDVTGIDGEIGMDGIDLAALTGIALGAAGHPAAEPLHRGWVQGWRGKVVFQSLRGELPGGTELRPVSGTLRGDGQSIVLEDLKAGIGGGQLTGSVEGRQTPDGLSVSARAQLSGVDGKALKYRHLAMPDGRIGLKATLMSRGRSLAALSGALSGNGVVSLENAKIAGLDPRAFDAAIHAGDLDQVTDERKVKALVDPALAQGALQVASAEIPFDIRDGRLRVGATTLDGGNARAVVSGGYDMTADQIDIRVALSSSVSGSEGVRPEIQVFLHGTPDALDRDLDITSLSSWLMLRAIDRETKRLDRLQGGTRPSAVAVPPSTDQAAPPQAQPQQDQTSAPSDVRMPHIDPRKRAPAKPPAAAATVPPRHEAPPAAVRVPPLPPPIDIRPAPGVLQQKPRPAPRASF
ncbi:AsmA family protein [Afipia sp. TerB]